MRNIILFPAFDFTINKKRLLSSRIFRRIFRSRSRLPVEYQEHLSKILGLLGPPARIEQPVYFNCKQVQICLSLKMIFFIAFSRLGSKSPLHSLSSGFSIARGFHVPRGS
jgi:hypothetical protein